MSEFFINLYESKDSGNGCKFTFDGGGGGGGWRDGSLYHWQIDVLKQPTEAYCLSMNLEV